MLPAIEVKNLSKIYNIAHRARGYVALRDVLTNIFRNPFNFTRNKFNQAVTGERKEKFWALKNISFEVAEGEILGIIGANGAGKSTLLKILSRITFPAEGEVRLRGRASSLLEVGTGFHPELTGRENIYLNGAILGMGRAEINSKFDDIVEFSGVERFLDTPVKRYSSGMQVRLAFAVAAHLEPDILIIDEVLAVGDASFQKKSLGKMEEVTKKDGRTILFVSHNMDAIQNLCGRCILLEKGKIKTIGETKKVIAAYLNDPASFQAEAIIAGDKNKPIEIKAIRVIDGEGRLNSKLDIDKPFRVEVDYVTKTNLLNSYIGVGFVDMATNSLFVDTLDIDTNKDLYHRRKAGSYTAIFKFDANIFNRGSMRLFVRGGIFPHSRETLNKIDGAVNILFGPGESFVARTLDGRRNCHMLLKIDCEVRKN